MITLFTEDEKQRIEQAIFEAEERTSAEIVPCIIDASDRYDGTLWKSAVLGGLTAMVIVLVFVRFYEGWGWAWIHTPWGLSLVMLGMALVASLATYTSPSLRRWLTASETLDERVHRRAMQAFVDEEVFATRERTGILIFISLFEHRIEVLGDAGINARVSADEWVAVVRRLQEAIRQDRLAEGLVDAIGMCGEMLERSGLAVRADDTDELANRVRLVRYER